MIYYNFIASILGGGIMAAIITALFNVHIEKKRERRNKKAEAYANYIRISEKHNTAMTPDENDKIAVEYSQACGDLCIYATNDILSRVSQNHAKEEKTDNYYDTPEGHQAYIAMIDAMRKEITDNSEDVSYNTIAGVMGFQGIRSGRWPEEER